MSCEKNVDISILCAAYNHEKYIRKTLEGFLMQKGSFSYEIIVHDDASTDGTTDILKEYQRKYPDKIRLILQTENQYSQKKKILFGFLFPEVRGKYIAVCEGDDEWIYEGKLQRQFHLMEEHPEVSLCLHNALRIDERTGESMLQVQNMDTGYQSDEEIILCKYGSVPTASFFLRTEYIKNLPKYFYEVPVGDEPLKHHCALKGQIYYINEVWSIRNFMHDGSWNQRRQNDEAYILDYYDKYAQYLWKYNRVSEKRFKKYISEYQRTLFTLSLKKMVEKKNRIVVVEKFIEQKNKQYEQQYEDILDELEFAFFPKCIDYYDKVKQFIDQAKERKGYIYIYGAGAIARQNAEKMLEWGYKLDGFVVSDMKDNEPVYMGHNVQEIGNLLNEKQDSYFWLCMNESNKREARMLLKELGFTNVMY